MRIVLMVLRNFFLVPGFLIRLPWMGKHRSKEQSFDFIKRRTTRVNRTGRVTIEAYGQENIPKEDGFIFYPNHQGLFDVLAFLESCPRPFSFVIKKEAKNIPLVKQIIGALKCLAIDRQDLRQSMKVIQEMSSRVKGGENFLIFAEGTRSKKGNRMLDMKGGSFKGAIKAKCPIVPCALVDAFVPFDINSIKRVTVKIFYLKPIPYEEYKDMTTLEIATMVKARIEEVLIENSPNG